MRPAVMVLTAVLATWAPQVGSARPQQTPVFRSVTERVTVAATVRDRRGRPVTNLKLEDFHLLDNGLPRTISDFQRDKAPMSLAILADYSGSMDVAAKRDAARDMVRQLVGFLTADQDKVGLFAFDQELKEVAPLKPAPARVLAEMDRLEPWGKTRLFDAIAGTGRKLAESGEGRRAVVVLTDGEDNASQMTPAQVSAIASSIDVPVYILMVVSPLDRVGSSSTSFIDPQLALMRDGGLGNLARWTGGDILVPVKAEDITAAAEQIITELRQQYLLGFEPSRQPGWHPLELRTRQNNLIVRARSGYVVPGGPAVREHD